MSRSHVLRKSIKGHNTTRFIQPFSEIGYYNYTLTEFVKPLVTQSSEEAFTLAGDFPSNIVEWIWSSPGENDGDSWLLLCQLNTGAYAFYRAWCDYTGFACQGGMSLTVSRDLAVVIEHGMHNYDYVKYEAETVVV